jgi:hypothetical protein
MDIDPSHLVGVLSQFGHSGHLLGGRTASPIPHGLDVLFLVALKTANRPAWISGNPFLHSSLPLFILQPFPPTRSHLILRQRLVSRRSR